MSRDTDARRAAAHALFGVDTQAAGVTADRIIDAYLAALVPNDGATALVLPGGNVLPVYRDGDDVGLDFAPWVESACEVAGVSFAALAYVVAAAQDEVAE